MDELVTREDDDCPKCGRRVGDAANTCTLTDCPEWSDWRTDDQLTAALRAIVACASHLTTLGRPDLSPIGDYGDLIECPRCEGQTYDRGSCSLCRNVGMLNATGEAIRV